MREETLKEFFARNLDAKVLAADLVGSMVTTGTMTKHPIENMSETFRVSSEHLARACDAVLSGDIAPKDLQASAFASLRPTISNMTPTPATVTSLTKQLWIGRLLK